MVNYLKVNWYKYFMITFGCIIMGIALNVFYVPNKFLNGGIGGIAVLGYYIAGLPIGILNLVLNVPLFFVAYKYIDKEYTVGAVFGTIIYSFFLDIFNFMSRYTVVHDPLLACIAGGVLYGIGAACMYRVDGSGGGTDIIGAIVQRNYSISVSTTGFLFNIALLGVSVFYFGIEPVLYTLLTFFVMTKTCNTFTTGFDFKKNIIIISNKSEEIAEAIIEVVGRGVTYLHGEGAYTHQDRKVLFVVVKLIQLAKIKKLCQEIDPSAFMIIHDVNDVFGRGFTLKATSDDIPRPPHLCSRERK